MRRARAKGETATVDEPPKAWLAIKAEADRLGVIQAYHADLEEHDLRMIRELPPGIGFAWSMRSCGTNLIAATSEDAYEYAKAVDRAMRPALWYWWDAKAERLAACEKFEDALELLRKELRKLPRWRIGYSDWRGGHSFEVCAIDAEDAAACGRARIQIEGVGVTDVGRPSLMPLEYANHEGLGRDIEDREPHPSQFLSCFV
jgi:hypothetical protein